MPKPPVIVPVELEVGARLVPRATAQHSGRERLERRVRRELQRLLGILGLPGKVEVVATIVSAAEDAERLRMRVHGRECRYPAELLSRVWSKLDGRYLAPSRRGGAGAIAVHHTARVVDVVGTVCREVVIRRPSVLLSQEQAARYVAGKPARKLDAGWVAGVLGPVVDARVAVADRKRVGALLADHAGKLCGNAAEVVIERLRRPVLTVLIRRDYLRTITTGPSAGYESVVDRARDQVSKELGIAPPEVVFVHSPLMPERGFAFVVNSLETLTWNGLRPDQCLAGDAAETLRALDLPGDPALHPVTETDCAVLPLSLRRRVEEFHIETWGPAEYLGLCLESAMREYASCLIDAGTVSARVDGLTWVGSASGVLGRRLPAERVVRLMRLLLREQVSVSDFVTLIEVLAEQDVSTAGDDDGMWSARADQVRERRDRDAVGAARRRLSRQVTAKVVPGGVGRAVPATVLDEQLQHAVSAAVDSAEALPADDLELLNASVGAFLDAWPAERWPALVTNAKLRGHVHAVLAPQFPSLNVVAYEELAPDVELQLAEPVTPVLTPIAEASA